MRSGRDNDELERVDRFRELYEATYPRIVAYCLRRARSREDALDAVSETFAIVWRRLDHVPGDGRSVPWVYGVARRVLANQYRSLDRAERLAQRLKDERGSGVGHVDFDLVHEALANLSPRDRDILTLAAWDDLDNAEIAEALSMTEKTVAVRLHRARKRLGRELASLGMRQPAEKNRERVKSEGGGRTLNRVKGTGPGPEEDVPHET